MASADLVFWFWKKISKILQKGIDKVCLLWYYSVADRYTKGGVKMAKKVKVNISLAEEIHSKGKDMAEKMGIPFSTFVSVLISNESKKKGM